jgi:hypothetical protein
MVFRNVIVKLLYSLLYRPMRRNAWGNSSLSGTGCELEKHMKKF